jgi:hypothetical protein
MSSMILSVILWARAHLGSDGRQPNATLVTARRQTKVVRNFMIIYK